MRTPPLLAQAQARAVGPPAAAAVTVAEADAVTAHPQVAKPAAHAGRLAATAPAPDCSTTYDSETLAQRCDMLYMLYVRRMPLWRKASTLNRGMCVCTCCDSPWVAEAFLPASEAAAAASAPAPAAPLAVPLATGDAGELVWSDACSKGHGSC